MPRSKKEQENKKEKKIKTKAKRMKTKQDQKKEERKETNLKEVSQEEVSQKEELLERQKKEKIKAEVKEEKKETQETETKETIEKSHKEENTTKEEKQEQQTKLIRKDTLLNETQLKKIQEEIKKQTTISEEKKKKINGKVFQNIFIAAIIILYFIFINLGFENLKAETFLKDLQVFSIITIGITIFLFERAYHKDSGEITMYGIEALVLSISTLMMIYIRDNYTEKFIYIINTIAMLFAIYYVAKAIIIYHKMMKKALKQTSDIHKIAKN